MNFIKRGFISVLRKPSKTLILLLLIFILGNVIAGAISVREAVKNTQGVMRDKIGVIVNIQLDQEKLISIGKESFSKVEPLSNSEIDDIGKSKYIKYYDYFTRMWLQSVSMNSYYGPNTSSTFSKDKESRPTEGPAGFQFSGGQNPNISDIEQGKAVLVNGRTFTKEEMNSNSNVVLISKNLAETNNLSIGSIIKFKRDILKYLNGNQKMEQPQIIKTLEFDFTIIGIFEPKENVAIDGNGQLQVLPSELENTIYTTNGVINNCNTLINEAEKEANGTEIGTNFSDIEPIFALKNPLYLEAFKAEAKDKLPEYYKFTDNSEELNNIAAPMENMDWIAGIVLYAAIGSTIIILSLLVTLFLRDRRYEMGIYLSLGERKFRIAAQIIVEVMAIAIIAITLSLFSGNALAKNMSSKMLENQIIKEQQNNPKDIGKKDPYGPTITYTNGNNFTQDLISSYTVKIDVSTIFIFYSLGIGTVLISTLIPIAYTLRLNPKKILM